jgi:hypothetical protein
VLNLLNGGLYQDGDARRPALRFQHGHNLASGTITEELSQSFLVKANAMFLYQGNEIGRRVAGQGRFAEMRIRREKVFRAAMHIREVAAAPAGDQYLLPDTIGMFKNQDTSPTLPCLNGTHQASRASAENDCIESL